MKKLTERQKRKYLRSAHDLIKKLATSTVSPAHHAEACAWLRRMGEEDGGSFLSWIGHPDFVIPDGCSMFWPIDEPLKGTKP